MINKCNYLSTTSVAVTDNYSEKCRMQRRIEMRREVLVSYLGQGIREVEKMESSYSIGAVPMPVVGAISIPGRQRVMEDSISIRPNLCSPDINCRRPVDFFAVYDGHGGRHANPTVMFN